MTRVGTIAEIWRYPVKSMAGESLENSQLGPGGLYGDRAWAIRDEVKGEIRGAKKIPRLLECAARYTGDPGSGGSAEVRIALPDHDQVSSASDDVNARLSATLSHDVTLWPLEPSENTKHYELAPYDHPDLEQELRSIFGLLPDEPFPDLSDFPEELKAFKYASPPGTYFDAFPLNFTTDATLRSVQALAPQSQIDVRRFRPNFLIAVDAPETDFPEQQWLGRTLQIGDTSIKVGLPCPRCVMVTHPQGDLPKDPGIMRTLVREANQTVGVYATAENNGTITVGDPVVLI
jgi:uncharacterized protein